MKPSRILITGGCGFIGCHLADYFIKTGHDVVIFDNLYRKGVHHNVCWLRESHGDQFTLIEGDLRDYQKLLHATEGAQAVYHVAGQTAVTTSVANPREDFEINALGTFNALEAARHTGDNPVFIFTSTNKVYGKMDEVAIVEETTRYTYRDLPYGIDESCPLDFHSPYGCSKGTADQYVRDYARIYGLPTVVFRMSSIYGPHQFGREDQAWVAYFVIATVNGWPITIYGDGKQVRDVLYISDLVRAFELATEYIAITAGQTYNIGGGPGNTISIWTEFAPLLSQILGCPVKSAGSSDWRPGDQRVYISDSRKAWRDFGWAPQVGVEEGLRRLSQWVLENKELFEPSGG
ncbi:GDP-mannose 4,6-dehydratase [Candidatus Poribacteria bacterium]|nr:GDP-mannose 4,6-dehydratase [Candidatus Poribacteria bacterium]